MTDTALDELRKAIDRYDVVTQGGFVFENPNVYEPLRADVINAARGVMTASDWRSRLLRLFTWIVRW